MATTFEPLLIGENRWLNAIAVTEANNAAIPITRTRAVKNYSCSFCKNEGHTIQKCTSIRLSLELDKVELNVENFVPVIVEEINRTMGIGTYNHDNFHNIMTSYIHYWIRNYDKPILMAMCFKIKEHIHLIYGEQQVISTKMKKQEYRNILGYYFTAIMTDAVNYHFGFFTNTFRCFITKKMLKFLNEIGITEQPEVDAQQYYHYMRNHKFYDKKLNHLQILDVLQFMKNDPRYSYSFDLLGEEKHVRISNIIISIEIHLNNKHNRNHPKITIGHEFIGQGLGEQETLFDCAICFDNYSLNKEIKLNCGHNYCKECIFTTMETNINKNVVPPCPLCRTVINKIMVKDGSDYQDFIKRFHKNI